MTEIVRYRSSDVRCPVCQQWRRELTIRDDGTLVCAGCPALARMRRPRGKRGNAA